MLFAALSGSNAEPRKQNTKGADLASYDQRGSDPFRENFNPTGEFILRDDALEDFCVDVSVYSLLKFKEIVRER